MTAKRGQLVIPDGWQVRRNARVQVLPLQVEGARPGITGRPPQVWQPLGSWRVIDRSPDVRGVNSWWLQPADEQARVWVYQHPKDTTQGCVTVPGRLIVPDGLLDVTGEVLAS